MKNAICSILLSAILLNAFCSCTAKETETERQSDEMTEEISEKITEEITTAPETEPVFTLPEFTTSNNTIEYDTYCQYAAVLDVNTNEILYQKGGLTTKMYPASTTKILTAIIVMNLCELSEKHTVGDELDLVASDASVAGLREGDELTVESLLYALLLPSGNDAAYALAACAGKHLSDKEVTNQNAVKLFVREMNRFGKSVLGFENTNFTCPDGYPSDRHYTCLSDMMKMAYTAHGNSKIMKIMGTRAKTVSVTNGGRSTRLSLSNTNSLLSSSSSVYYRYTTGMKTGTTRAAGKCLVASAEKDGREVIVFVFKADEDWQRYADARGLLVSVLGE